MELSQLKLDGQGLITAVAQDRLSGQVRMVAWMSVEALRATLETGKATFFSRSRGRLWTKGETSGHFLHVRDVLADCDLDTLLLLVDPVGPSCHTGRPACFFNRVSGEGEIEATSSEAEPFVEALERELALRKHSTAERSYTKSLLDAGALEIGAKLREEAGELAVALDRESEERVASEAADVIYHLMVGLQLRGVSWQAVLKQMDARTKLSGHAEKAQRSSKSS